jgi:hypothetical protein
MFQDLVVLTRYSRGEDFLERCSNSLSALNYPLHWVIISEKVPQNLNNFTSNSVKQISFLHLSNTEAYGMLNTYLDMSLSLPPHWIYVLDDDNLMSPNFKELMQNPLLRDNKVGLISFNQKLEHGIRVPKFEVTKIDFGQYIFKSSFSKNLRFWETYRGDGYFAQELSLRLHETGYKTGTINETYSYYNKQVWGK